MKLALDDFYTTVDEAFPNVEVELPAKGKAKPVTLVFRNVIQLTPERRQEFYQGFEQVFNSEKEEGVDAISAQVDVAKATLALVASTEEAVDLLDEQFSRDPDARDARWLQMLLTYAEATGLGEAGSSQEL